MKGRRIWYTRRLWRTYAYFGFCTSMALAGGWWGWSAAPDAPSRFGAVVVAIGMYGMLLAVGDILFSTRRDDAFMVRVDVGPDRAPLEYPCSTYEMAFEVALAVQLRGFELTGVWLGVSITPDQPEKVK
jgi:hypothetical protein